MNLVYQIPNKLYYLTQVFDYHTYKQLHHEAFKSKNIKLEPVTKNNFWNPNLLKNLKNCPDSSFLNPNHPILEKLKNILSDNPYIKIDCSKIYYQMHSMRNNAGINWHNDVGHDYGITYYINRRWNHEFGGEFLFTDESSNGFIPVIGNSMVILKSPFQHKVTPVLNSIVPRKTIQMFIPSA